MRVLDVAEPASPAVPGDPQHRRLADLHRRLARLWPMPVAVDRAEGARRAPCKPRDGGLAVKSYFDGPSPGKYRFANVKDDVLDASVRADALRHQRGNWRTCCQWPRPAEKGNLAAGLAERELPMSTLAGAAATPTASP